MICGGDCGGGGFVLVIVVFCVIGVVNVIIGCVFIMIGFFILCNIGIGCSFWRNDVIIFFLCSWMFDMDIGVWGCFF